MLCRVNLVLQSEASLLLRDDLLGRLIKCARSRSKDKGAILRPKGSGKSGLSVDFGKDALSSVAGLPCCNDESCSGPVFVECFTERNLSELRACTGAR